MSTADGIPPISKARLAELNARSKRLHTAVPVADVIADLQRWAEQAMREASPELRAELARREAELDKTFTLEEARRLGEQAEDGTVN